MGVTIFFAALILFLLVENMKALVDFTTVVAFLFAPILAAMNLICCKKFSKEWKELNRPFWLRALSHMGMVFLIGFSIYFILIQLIIE